MTTIAVAGATGTVGQHVVKALRGRDATVVPIARSYGVDLFAGKGVDATLRGVSAVIDVSNVVTTNRNESVEFFTCATGNLLRACRLNEVDRYVVLSIVGIDDVPYGYYAGKRAQERLVTESGLTVSVVRATQFHEFAGQMLDRLSIGPVAVVPKLLIRPVAASAVAEHLARIALAPQPPAMIELAGPECLCLPEMSRRLCRYRHDRKLLIPIRLPGRAGRAMANGVLLPDGPFEMDDQTFNDWLVSSPSDSTAQAVPSRGIPPRA